MSNSELFYLMMASMSTLGFGTYLNDFDEDDITYQDNQPVQDLLFDFYIGMLQLDCMDPEPDNYEERIELFANNINARLKMLLPDEQAYIRRKMASVLHVEEDEKTLERRKEND